MNRSPKSSERFGKAGLHSDGMQTRRFAFGPFELDVESGCLLREGRSVALGARGSSLLAALIAAEGRTLTKSALMDAAWPGLAIEESNLTVQIAALRKLMGPAPDGAAWIDTVPRVGYRFSGPMEKRVAWSDGEGTRGCEVRSRDRSNALRQSRRRWRQAIPGRRHHRRSDHGARPVPLVPCCIPRGELRPTQWPEGFEGFGGRTRRRLPCGGRRPARGRSNASIRASRRCRGRRDHLVRTLRPP